MSVFWRPRGCVLWYDFAELSGDTVYDLSGNNNHGTIYNCEWRRGHLVGALYFNGENAYVEIPYSSELNPRNAVTVEAFIKKLEPKERWERIFSSGSSNKLELIARETDVNHFAFYPSIDGSFRVVSDPDLWEVGKLYHVVGTYDGSFVRLYVNGVMKDELEYSGTLDAYTSNPCIGWRAGAGDEHLHGTIYFLRIYEIALSEREIKAHYHYLSQKYILHPAII